MNRVIVSVSCYGNLACENDPASMLATLARKMGMVAKSGSRTGVAVDQMAPFGHSVKELQLPAAEYVGSFLPEAPLDVDSAYALEIVSDADVVFGFSDSFVSEQVQAVAASKVRPFVDRIPLFTGSAPIVTRLDIANSPSKPIMSIRVRFSEPVRLGTLANDAFSVLGRPGPLAGCVWRPLPQTCADAESTEMTDLFDFFFKSAVTFDEISAGTVRLDAAIQGSGRTSAEGAALPGRLATARDGSILSLGFADTDWASCSSTGDLKCIRYLGPSSQ